MKLWLQQLKIGWRVARSRASSVGAAVLALMLAVGLSSAIFTTGGLRPLLSFAADSHSEQVASQTINSVVEVNRVKTDAPGADTARDRNREARAQPPIVGHATARAAAQGFNQRSRRQGYAFTVATLLRLLRHGNHRSVARLLGNESERGQ